MAKIKPFVAFLPDQVWLGDMLERGILNPNHLAGDPLRGIQSLLEPAQQSEAGLHATRNRESMQGLLRGNFYQKAEAAAFYLYEQESFQGSQFGIWTLTSLDDVEQGNLVPHEETLTEHLDNLKAYRNVVGMEGRPILLTYARDHTITKIIEDVASRKPVHHFQYQQMQHRLWSITDPATLEALQSAFEGIKRVYVADGHHRLAAAAKVHEDVPQWISTLYITTGQLRCREFNRTVIPAKPVSETNFFDHLQQYGYITSIPGDKALRPESEKRFGVNFGGRWYQYDLKPEWQLRSAPDVSFLQQYILKPLFGIADPRTDPQLRCWPATEWAQMLDYSKQHTDVVLFSCRAMTTAQLMEAADRKISLPPKSTYVEPKIPYGLVICDHHQAGNRTTAKKQEPANAF